jgi:hypothetical protein
MELTDQCLPISVHEARAIGLIDDVILHDDLGESPFGGFRGQITRIAENLAHSPQYRIWLAQKQATRERDERFKPLQHFRSEELEEMKKNFWGENRSYHLARAAFVRKQPRPPASNMIRSSKLALTMNTVQKFDVPTQTAISMHTRVDPGLEQSGTPRSGPILEVLAQQPRALGHRGYGADPDRPSRLLDPSEIHNPLQIDQARRVREHKLTAP